MSKKLILLIALLLLIVLPNQFAKAAVVDSGGNSLYLTANMPSLTFNKVYDSIAGFNLSATKPDQDTPDPKTKPPKALKTYVVVATGYSSTPDQTDSSPFITARGTYVRDGIVAANFLPFGTVIRIPEVYGDKTFVVEDRMNSRYWYNVDVWFPERGLAKTFGAQRVKIEVVATNS